MHNTMFNQILNFPFPSIHNPHIVLPTATVISELFRHYAYFLGKKVTIEGGYNSSCLPTSNISYDMHSQLQERIVPRKACLCYHQSCIQHNILISQLVPSYLLLLSLPEVVAAQNNSHDVLADVMHISFHSCQHYCTLVRILQVKKIARVTWKAQYLCTVISAVQS